MWGLGGVGENVRVGGECESWEEMNVGVGRGGCEGWERVWGLGGEDKKLEVGMPMGNSQV